MADNAFLDKSIVLAYIFLSDPHHRVCREYINIGNAEYYATKEVEDVYHRRKDKIIEDHKEAVFNHIQEVTKKFDGELTAENIEEIRGSINRRTNPAWRYLVDFYTGKAGESVYVVTKELREIIRDLEQRADARQSTLYERMHGWLRFKLYDDLQAKLQMLVERGEEEDVRMILDAHDVATNLEGTTELATANPKDFADPEVEAVIEKYTNIDHVELVFVGRNYEPA